MKKIFLYTIFVIAVGCKNDKVVPSPNEHQHENTDHQQVNKETASPEKKKVLSPHTSVMTNVGSAHIHIDYSSPGVRNRMIFGGLLAYGEIWQSGAHNATWIETNKDLIIEGIELKAGKYGFFTIPSQEEWTVIFNTRWKQHGKDEYTAEEDVFRFKVKPVISDQITEHLTYQINETGNAQGTISLTWEKVRVEFGFKVKE